MLDAAEKACLAADGHQERVETLKACIKYEQDDIAGTKLYDLLNIMLEYLFNKVEKAISCFGLRREQADMGAELRGQL